MLRLARFSRLVGLAVVNRPGKREDAGMWLWREAALMRAQLLVQPLQHERVEGAGQLRW